MKEEAERQVNIQSKKRKGSPVKGVVKRSDEYYESDDNCYDQDNTNDDLDGDQFEIKIASNYDHQ